VTGSAPRRTGAVTDRACLQNIQLAVCAAADAPGCMTLASSQTAGLKQRSTDTVRGPFTLSGTAPRAREPAVGARAQLCRWLRRVPVVAGLGAGVHPRGRVTIAGAVRG
jgi:hypothetical protein